MIIQTKCDSSLAYAEADKPFDCIQNHPYVKFMEIKITREDTNMDPTEDVIAEIELCLMDISDIHNAGYTVSFIAEEFIDPIFQAFQVLEYHPDYNPDFQKLLLVGLKPVSGYIKKFFVSPEYRNQGYEQFILKNLKNILKCSFNLNLYGSIILSSNGDPSVTEKYSSELNKIYHEAGYTLAAYNFLVNPA